MKVLLRLNIGLDKWDSLLLNERGSLITPDPPPVNKDEWRNWRASCGQTLHRGACGQLEGRCRTAGLD